MDEPAASHSPEADARRIQEKDRFGRYLGIDIIEARQGYARARMPLEERHQNGVGIAHGGAMFTLADIAFAAASNAGASTAVLNLATSVTYLRPGTKGPLEAEALAVTVGRRVSAYEVRVTDADGALLSIYQITGYHTERPL